jgi:hypothetical protein
MITLKKFSAVTMLSFAESDTIEQTENDPFYLPQASS